MDARDPLSGRTITTVFPQGRNRVILTLSTGEQILLVSSSSSELPSLSVLLQQVTAAFDLLQPFLGLTKYQTGDYLAFTHIPGDTLNQRISRISVNPLLDWSYESLAGHMQMMGNALSHLHQSQLIHWKINTRSFFCGVNNKIILGGLEEIKVAGNGKFEKAKYKELTWLGACFASMITKVDFKQLVELDANKQLSMCRTNPKFTGVVYDMTKDALSGQWRGNYLPDDTTMSQLFETSRIVLPPPPISFSRLSSKEERTLLEALAGLATEGNESWDEAPKPVRIGGNKDSDADDTKSLPEMPSFLSSFSVDFCGVCRGPAVFSAPCTHSYCLPCFASHVHSLAAQSLQADSLICRVCARPLPVDFVFEHIRGNSVVISALDEALLRSQLISCPKCKRKIDRMLDEGPARNATCTYCGKKFCSKCKKKPHYNDPCPKSTT